MNSNDLMNYSFYGLKENNIEPFPIQRIKWVERMLGSLFPDAKSIFSIIKKNNYHEDNSLNIKSLSNLTDTGETLERTLKQYKDKYVGNNVVSNASWDYLIKSATYNISFMYNWQLFKQSYKFDRDTFDLLCNDTDITELPLSIINSNLPYPAFFIDNKFVSNTNKVFRGCFVSIMKDPQGRDELGLFFVEDTVESDYEYCLIPLYMGDSTLLDIMKKRDKIYNVNSNINDIQTITDVGTKAIKAIVYICSSNKEIETIKININKNNNKKTKNKSKKAKTISQNLVGYRMGNTIRRTKKVYITDSSLEKEDNVNVEKKKLTKSPHMRMAHYHHFWTGPKNEPDKRKLIVKFIPPLFINSNHKDNEEFQPTLHNVK